MTGRIIDGKQISQDIKEKTAREVQEFRERTGRRVRLAVVIVGDDPASRIYVNGKKKACELCGIDSVEHALSASTSQETLMATVEALNSDPEVNGILVQLPLPEGLDENAVLMNINPLKDVDGFHPVNVGRMMTVKRYEDYARSDLFLPCTPHGCMELLERQGVEVEGKNAVVVGRSNIVGKPMAMLLMARNATVTVCHSRTRDLAERVSDADIVVAAIGRAGFIKGEWIKEGAAVIDVGMNRTEDGPRGDVEFKAALERAGCITPVPGGVGPMTIAMLMKNTLKAARLQAGVLK